MTKPAAIPGPHHCAGTARLAAQLIFGVLEARCRAHGGSLTLDDLAAAKAQVAEGLVGGFDWFETTHTTCMTALGALQAPRLTRQSVLASLLLACDLEAARRAFATQMERFGPPWARQFFDGLAEALRRHGGAEADRRIGDAYARHAVASGAKLTTAELFDDPQVRDALADCAAVMAAPTDIELRAQALSDAVNEAVTARTGVRGAHLSKITIDEAKHFFLVYPPKLRARLAVAPSRAAE